MRVLIFGATGMLGSALVKVLESRMDLSVYASLHISKESVIRPKINYVMCDVLDSIELNDVFEKIRPEVVVNCIAPSRPVLRSNNVLEMIPLCSLLPHRLQILCLEFNSRFIHISTDAVFSGRDGFYRETDNPDPIDTYGRAKLLGEVSGINSISLRTSMIGHENGVGEGLLDWFLNQKNSCKGYRKAVFSGLPACILAEVIADHVISNTKLCGIYNVAATPISKYALLCLVADTYHLPVRIIPDDSVTIDLSLSPEKFNIATGFVAPLWIEMIQTMYADYLETLA
jgi:dTDP-4-dehydrorhamnose reductase